MRAPGIFLAYAPRGAGLRCALAFLETPRDAYGWFTGPCHDASVASRYFLLQDFYTQLPARYAEVDESALHTAWPLDEARRHELAAMQEAFRREWLFYRDDPRAALELQAYAEAELAAGEVNFRFARLAKFSTQQPNWTFYSAVFPRTLLRQLSRRWPLEFGLDEDEPRRRADGPRS